MSDFDSQEFGSFTKPASATPFAKLPQELITKILDLTFGVRSRDVARCRLVSQEMHTLTSPYLIRFAVVAFREEAVVKLQQLIRHPYFSKHVTHLIWDPTGFMDFGDRSYSEAFTESAHLQTYRITRSGEEISYRDERLAGIRAEIKGHWDDNPWSHWDALVNSGDGIYPRIDKSLVAGFSPAEMLDIVDNSLYMVGRGRGRKEYRRRCQWQQTSIKQGLDLTWWVKEAINSFPSLQHACLSDWRALVYPGESYAELCRHMFGEMICPNDEPEPSHEFLAALHSPIRGSWKSISIGYHPFLSNAFDAAGLAQDWADYIDDGELSELPAVETLRLCIDTYGWDLGDKQKYSWGGGFSTEMMSKLRDLELSFDDEDSPNTASRLKAMASSRVHYDACYALKQDLIPPHLFFWHLLASRKHDFENLRILTLRDFTFEQGDIFDFLVSLKKLHTIHLIDCMSLGTYSGFLTSSRTLPHSSLLLTSVEIYGLRFLDIEHQAEPQLRVIHDLRNRMRVKRGLDWDLAVECSLIPQYYPFTVRDWPCERPELEAAILDGRHNGVVRKARAAPDQEAKEGWAKIPIQDFLV